MVAAVAALRQVLEQRFPDAVPPAYRTAPQVATGIAKLDRILPGGGLPRGRLAAWIAGGAATAILRAACEAVDGRGERAVWVNGAGTVAGAGWGQGPYLVRPGEKSRRCSVLKSCSAPAASGWWYSLVCGWEMWKRFGCPGQYAREVVPPWCSAEAFPPRGSACLRAYVRRTFAGGWTPGVHPRRWRRSSFTSVRLPWGGVRTLTFGYLSCTMTFVCLWSPDWRTGVGPTPELAERLLEVAPRVRVEHVVWADARGLPALEVAEALRARIGASTRAGIAATPVAAEVAARGVEGPIAWVEPGTERAFLAPFLLHCLIQTHGCSPC